MRPYVVAALIGFASFAFVAACDFKLGDDTQGDMGNLRFSYTGAGCFFGCSLDQNALEGAAVSVSVAERSERVRGARTHDAAVAKATAASSCWCSGAKRQDGSSGLRSIDPNETCTKDEKRTCSLSIVLVTGHPGDTKLEVLEDGEVIDRVDIHVRKASRMELTVQVNGTKRDGASDGAFEAKANDSIALAATVFDEHDDEMMIGTGGLHYTYADEHVVRRSSGGFLFESASESMTAMTPGESSVTVSTGFVKETARFRVAP
ncbi:MAG: hypothetical protein JWP87_1796 [Labilithrix sp.]|jgi:hypothetical protein|nr:hypothetical protein [Labilithrix sp.]